VLLDESLSTDVFNYDAKLYPIGDKKKSTGLNLKSLDSKKTQTINLNASPESLSSHDDYFDQLITSATSSLTDTSYTSKIFSSQISEGSNHSPLKTSNRNASSNLYFSGYSTKKIPEQFDIFGHTQDLTLDAGLTNQN
jgi:hypothetical protein